MSYVRASVNLTVDNPHADGQITQWGLGRDWPAYEPREEQTHRYAADLAASPRWTYGNQFEYLEKLRAIAPIGSCTEADMSLDDWTVGSGQWKLSSAGGALRRQYLHFYDARPGLTMAEMGRVISKTSLNPNLELHAWRFPPDSRETNLNTLSLGLMSSGVRPSYALVFPAGQEGSTEFDASSSSHQRYPQLWGKPQGIATWTLINEFAGGGTFHESREQAQWQGIRVEYVAGWLLVRWAGLREVWAYGGPWIDATGTTQNFWLDAGPVQVQVVGHTAMFTLTPVVYPTEAVLRPNSWLIPGTLVNPTPAYRYIHYTPSGAGLSIAAEAQGTGRRPKVTFTSDTGAERAVLYNVQEYRTATIGNATSNPVESKGSALFAVKEISGELNSQWRGATLHATLKGRDGLMPTIPANGKVKAEVTLDSSDDPTYYTLFQGYITPREPYLEQGALGKVEHHIQAADWIESRARKKCMYAHCAYEGWPIKDAFEHILNRAGVPASLISVDASVSAEVMGANYYLPIPNPPGDRGLQFRPDEGVVAALDKLVSTRNLRWGQKQDGKIFLAPRYTHTRGHYDFTIDDTTTSAADFISFRHVRGTQDYYNVLMAIVGEGWGSSARQYVDLDSISNSADEDFIGEDWWRFEGNPDADNVDQAMNHLWDTRKDDLHVIYVEMHDHPELLPDQELRVRLTSTEFDITQNSIFRITRKTWQITDPAGAARFTQTLEAVLVEEGTPDA